MRTVEFFIQTGNDGPQVARHVLSSGEVLHIYRDATWFVAKNDSTCHIMHAHVGAVTYTPPRWFERTGTLRYHVKRDDGYVDVVVVRKVPEHVAKGIILKFYGKSPVVLKDPHIDYGGGGCL